MKKIKINKSMHSKPSRRQFLKGFAMLSAIGIGATQTPATLAMDKAAVKSTKRNYVLVHGAWHGGWAWGDVAEKLRKAGHTVTTPTLAGLGDRAHINASNIGLHDHINDVVNHIEMEDLHDVILVGHSYGGIVITGVLGKLADRVSSAVYLDALVPEKGKGLADYVPPKVKDNFMKMAAEGQLVPPRDPSYWGVTEPEIKEWVNKRLTPQSPHTFIQQVGNDPIIDGITYTYIKCETNPSPLFKKIAENIKKDKSWNYIGVNSHHNIMILDPDLLVDELLKL